MNSRRPNLNGQSSNKSREQRSREVHGEIDDFYRKNLSYDPSSYNSRDAGKYGHSAREEYFDHENNLFLNKSSQNYDPQKINMAPNQWQ